MRTSRAAHSDLSIIIPAHNEEHRIGPTIVDYAEHFHDAQVVVVLNGCTDRTEDVVRAAQRRYANVRMVTIQAMVGKGGAVRTGFLLTDASTVAFVDADGSFAAVEMRKLCRALDGNDAVIASRWLPESRALTPLAFKRRAAGLGFNLLVRLLFGLRFKDTQCGAKVFRAAALRPIFDSIETANFAFDVDLLYLLKKRGAKIVEAPMVWRDAVGSKINVVRSGLTMTQAIIRLRLYHSPLRFFLPLYDVLAPTNPVRLYDRLRILIFNWRDITNPSAGGAELYLHEMAKHWVAQGHHVEWLTSRFKGSATEENVDGIVITRIGNALSLYALAPFVYVKKFRNKFDILIDSENTIPFFTPLFSMKKKICIMYQISRRVLEQELCWPLPSLLAFLEERIMPRLYRNVPFVTISRDTAADLVSFRLTKHPIEIVYSGVAKTLKPGKKSTRPLLLYVGRLKRFKRVDVLIRALPEIRRAVPELALHIAGSGDDEQRLRQLTADLGLNDAVTFEGHVSDQRKSELMQSAWAFVMPSAMEGWGIVIVESNASGTPAIGFNVPGVREAIVHGKTGLLVPDGENLAPAILRVLLDGALRERLQAGALEHAAAFSWEKSAADMLRLLTNVAVVNPVSLVKGTEKSDLSLRTGRQSFEPLFIQK